MPRYARNMAVLAKAETIQGVENAPSATTDGVLIAGDINVEALNVTYAERNLLLPYFGGSQSLIATVNSKVSFSVEWSTSGTAGTSAEWGDLLLGCATASASLATPTRVEHTPVSSALKSLTIYLYDDGVLHKLIGAMGNVKLSCKINETPKLMFEFLGSYTAVTAVALPAVTLTAWKTPLPVARANVVDITLGCTYAAGVLTGGTVFPSTGLELDFGNKTSFFSSLSSERAELTDRSATGSFELELTAAQEVTAMSDINANTLTGLGFTIGSVAGSKLIIFAPNVQRTAAKKVDRDGVRVIGFDAKLIPGASGNDEIRIVQL